MFLRNVLTGTAPRRPAEVVVEVGMAMLLVLAPLAFGVAQPWSRQLLLALVGVIALAGTIELLTRPTLRLRRTWAYLPVGLFLAWGLLQVVPLPTGLLGTLSPEAVNLREQADVASASATVSLYPLATMRDLRMLLAVVAVFLVVVNVYRRSEQVKGLLLAMAGSGTLVAALAVFQWISGTPTAMGLPIIADLVEPTVQQYVHPYSGPFLNHSHFGQYLNLAAGGALALIMIQLDEVAHGGRRKRLTHRFGDLLRQPDLRLSCVLLPAVVVMYLVLAGSLTRGGVVSAIIAGAIVVVLQRWSGSREGGSRGVLFAGLGLLAVAIGAAFGFDFIFERLGSLRDIDTAQGGRFELLRDLMGGVAMFPVTGTGLGTHFVVFPMLDKSGLPNLATHAENEYAQVLLETGAVGLACVLGFLGIVVANGLRVAADHRRFRGLPPVRSGTYGLLFGLIAILIHSFSDFGQHLPAVAMMTASTCGLLIVLPRVDSRRVVSEQPAEGFGFAYALRPIVGLGLVAALAWGWLGEDRDRLAMATVVQGEQLHAPDLDSDDVFVRDAGRWGMVQALEQAVALEPRDVELQYRLASIRYRVLQRTMEEVDETNAASAGLEAAPLAEQIADEADAALGYAPTFGRLAALSGVIRRFNLDDPSGNADIALALELSPQAPEVIAAAAQVAAVEGRPEEAVRLYRRVARIDPSRRNEAVEVFAEAGWPEQVVAITEGDPAAMNLSADVLAEMAAQAEASGEQERASSLHELAAKQRAESIALIRRAASRGSATPRMLTTLADIDYAAGEKARAIAFLKQALSGDYNNAALRMKLVAWLDDAGRLQEAHDQARLAVQLRSDSEEFQNVLADLKLRIQAAERQALTEMEGPKS